MRPAGRLSIRCALALAALGWCHADPSVAAALSELSPGVLGPPPGVYGTTQLLVPASQGAEAPEYRFAGQSSWLTMDRPLYLSAFAGEERSYTLELRHGADQSSSIRYTIDRRPPEPPRFIVDSGFVGSSLAIGFKGSDAVFISLDGGGFERFDPAAAPVISAPADATSIVHAAAYSVDLAGNRSRVVYGTWLLAPPGMQPSFSIAPESPPPSIVQAAAEGLSAEFVDMTGTARLILRVPEGTQPVVAINAESAFTSISSYVELPYSTAGSVCEITFPWGYAADIIAHYGYVRDGVISVSPTPLRLTPHFTLDEPIGIAETPLPPLIRAGSTSATVEWPQTFWLIMVSVDGGAFAAYSEPLVLRLADTPRHIAYYVQGAGSARSATRSFDLPAARGVVYPGIAGVEPGATYGSGVSIVAQGDQKIHYELSDDGAAPARASLASAVLPSRGLRLEGKAGSVVRYWLRLLPEAGPDRGIVERFIQFSIDREPPPVPQLTTAARSGADDQVIAFKPQDGQIYVSISDDGSAPFVKYDAPVTFTGSDAGRSRYIVKSYAEDPFGNRSAPMMPLRILIDRTSFYVDARGSPGASGTPDDPIPYLDDAIEAAISAGKRRVCIRGTTQLRRPVVVQGSLTIAGGFDAEWNDAPGEPATIAIQHVRAGASPLILVQGGTLKLDSLSIAMQNDSATTVLHADDGSISLVQTAIKASGDAETVVLSTRGSDVSLAASTIEMSGSTTARALDIRGSRVHIENVSITCLPSVRLFEAIRLEDVDASVTGLRIEASPEYALSGLSAIRSTVTVERSVMLVRGGIASCRLFGASGGALAISSSYIDSSWNGTAQMFSASDGAAINIAHLTALLDSPRTTFLDLSASTGTLRSSIVQSRRGIAVLVRSDRAPLAGTIGSNCLWGIAVFLDGSRNDTTVAALNRTVAPAVANFQEDPSRTFGGLVKGIWRLARTSACVDGGESFDWSSTHDVFGAARVSTQGSARPDIGAEEL